MKFRAIVATGIMLLGFAPHVAAQGPTTISAAEPLTGIVLGLGLLGLGLLHRR